MAGTETPPEASLNEGYIDPRLTVLSQVARPTASNVDGGRDTRAGVGAIRAATSRKVLQRFVARGGLWLATTPRIEPRGGHCSPSYHPRLDRPRQPQPRVPEDLTLLHGVQPLPQPDQLLHPQTSPYPPQPHLRPPQPDPYQAQLGLFQPVPPPLDQEPWDRVIEPSYQDSAVYGDNAMPSAEAVGRGSDSVEDDVGRLRYVDAAGHQNVAPPREGADIPPAVMGEQPALTPIETLPPNLQQWPWAGLAGGMPSCIRIPVPPPTVQEILGPNRSNTHSLSPVLVGWPRERLWGAVSRLAQESFTSRCLYVNAFMEREERRPLIRTLLGLAGEDYGIRDIVGQMTKGQLDQYVGMIEPYHSYVRTRMRRWSDDFVETMWKTPGCGFLKSSYGRYSWAHTYVSGRLHPWSHWIIDAWLDEAMFIENKESTRLWLTASRTVPPYPPIPIIALAILMIQRVFDKAQADIDRKPYVTSEDREREEYRRLIKMLHEDFQRPEVREYMHIMYGNLVLKGSKRILVSQLSFP
ncbi:hypothetical protein BV22DRAFT_1135556 [Leucogyrophana mollusca]|uniref:Uncharacterized protein n=1 Tax=Leucogyrophana mollusca TaxID=85980 RepID=A0ACB8AV77_9AGAM|nr:hypothetical protein BV22DRAFT_1135556 [Leucogyrophana mollusca]